MKVRVWEAGVGVAGLPQAERISVAQAMIRTRAGKRRVCTRVKIASRREKGKASVLTWEHKRGKGRC